MEANKVRARLVREFPANVKLEDIASAEWMQRAGRAECERLANILATLRAESIVTDGEGNCPVESGAPTFPFVELAKEFYLGDEDFREENGRAITPDEAWGFAFGDVVFNGVEPVEVAN